MLFEDTFQTIKYQSEGLFKDKGSRFIAHAFPVQTEEEIKNTLEEIRKKYHDARHHCFAYVLGSDKSAQRSYDDGEPTGTAGKPILNQLISKGLTNTLVVVVRYFGGIKLGVSGLINAYKSATLDALNQTEAITKIVMETYVIEFDYLQMNDMMKILKEDDIKIESQDFENRCKIQFSVRKNKAESTIERFKKLKSISLQFIHFCSM
ncbi:MAG: YigZ family protein [Lentimicrobiaceae bacterium]|nr:YigZ family protein [Lentimicrobiaceae bacterium]